MLSIHLTNMCQVPTVRRPKDGPHLLFLLLVLRQYPKIKVYRGVFEKIT